MKHPSEYANLDSWMERCPPIRPRQAMTIAACITAIVTLLSLNELQTFIAAGDSEKHVAYLPRHGDWRTVEQIAERAVAHVEHLPSGLANHAAQGGSGDISISGAAGVQGVLLLPDSLSSAIELVSCRSTLSLPLPYILLPLYVCPTNRSGGLQRQSQRPQPQLQQQAHLDSSIRAGGAAESPQPEAPANCNAMESTECDRAQCCGREGGGRPAAAE